MSIFKNILIAQFVILLASCGGGGSSSPTGNNAVGNVAPIASAGTDQNVVTSTLVTLDGSASFDANGDLITYVWSINTKPVASTVSNFTGNTTISPTFTPDVDGTYVISLVVNDGKVDSTADTVTINASSGNVAPTANAGPNQSVSTNIMVTLDGSASADANSDSLSYLWAIDTVPGGSGVSALSSTTEVKPTFTPDVDGSYVFSLTVSDGMLTSNIDTVTITSNTGNAVPLANAGPDANAITGINVILDGSASSDADGSITSYNWSVISVPGGSAVTALNNSANVNPDFTSDIDGAYQFSLVVNDGSDDSLVDSVVITAQPSVSRHVAELELAYMSVQGNEFSSPFVIPSLFDGSFLGQTYCLPSDPYITPVATSVSPTTVYGCNNEVSVTHTISANNASVIFTWTIPDYYIDFDGVANLIGFVDGYFVLTDVVVSVEVMLIDNGNGLFLYDVVGATSSSYNSASVIVNNGNAQSLIDSVLPQSEIGLGFSSDLESAITDVMSSGYIASLPDFMLD